MVELDVQITKDKTPVIYHDFFVNLIAKKKNSDQMSEHSIPIHELTHQQLQWLKLSPIHKENVTKYEFDDSDKEDNQPFPSLRKVLEVVNKKCGFNIEVKFPQLKKDMSSESETPFEINEYVDIILGIIESYVKERTVIISSFHPDICSLIRVKQKRFPLLFLTMGTTNKYMHYLDPRTHTIETATYFALSMNFTGIDVHAEDIIRNRTLINFVKFNKLVLFCWGEDLNSAQLIDELKEEGVDGIIYDKIDVFTQKTSFIFDKTVPDSTNFKDLIQLLLKNLYFVWVRSQAICLEKT
jgi:glycerophosphocholine phosphodiesterase GPCPD1